MAFNKQKVLDAAQKFLNQGKIPQAIAEYQTILRNEPKDQVTLMTIGDLFVRSGDTQQALTYYDQLAQIFQSDGFISKAIAIYKKIAKLAPDEVQPLEKLAELYVQQGVMSEARGVYLQVAENHLKSKRQAQAVETLRKLLDLEPDNLRVQLRLADLYQAIGQKDAAALAYLGSAHRMLDRGDFAEAKKMADRALQVSPKNARAATVKARAASALGETGEALQLLEQLPEDAATTETTRLLCDLYVRSGKSTKAVEIAKKAFARSPENYSGVFEIATTLIEGGEAESGLGLVGEVREAMMNAGDFERLNRALTAAAERLAGRLQPLEWLVDSCRRANDTVRLPDAIDQLAEACVSGSKLERAKELFEELLKLEPEDDNNRRRLNQVRQKLGLPVEGEEATAPAPVQVPAEAPPPFAQELIVTPEAAVVEVAPAPAVDEDLERSITQSLNDVDLYSSYGLTPKAIDVLESVLQRAPRHVAVLEKLLDLHIGAGNDRRTADLAATLEKIHREQGDESKAERFAELRRRYQRAAGLKPEEVAAGPAAAPAEFTIPTVPVEPAPAMEAQAIPEVAAEPAGEAGVHEVDLSAEWAALSTQAAEPAAAPPPVVEAKPAEIPVAETAPVEAQPAPVEVPSAPAEPVAAEPAAAAKEAAPPPAAPTPEPAKPAEEQVEYELELAPAAPASAARAEEKGPMTSADFLSDLAAEVDSLELGPAPPAAQAPRAATPAPPAAAVPAPPARAGEGGLSEVFEEFRAEFGEMGEEGEDPETHYNLGIAYREMGLLEEAIGEFQKVAKVVQKGAQFRYAMQCCTLLGLCFMDKGQPAIAAMWYKKALETPGLDQESILALRYDLGVSQELAGERKAALDSFHQVYAMNIDYRDVGDRIASLQKAQ